jgi:hypothetical protein
MSSRLIFVNIILPESGWRNEAMSTNLYPALLETFEAQDGIYAFDA